MVTAKLIYKNIPIETMLIAEYSVLCTAGYSRFAMLIFYPKFVAAADRVNFIEKEGAFGQKGKINRFNFISGWE